MSIKSERDPLQPESQRTLSTDEVFNAVKSLEGLEIHEDLTVRVGRRAGDNSSKGFSTDADKGIVYCPGPDNTDLRTPDQIVETVIKSVITSVRHNLNPAIGPTKANKSESYKTRQNDLVEAILSFIKMAEINSSSDNRPMEALEVLKSKFSEFMTSDNTTDTERMGESMDGVIAMAIKLRLELEPKAV